MKKDSSHTPLAIIGIGCRFPKADGLESYWSNLKRGVDAISDLPESHWKAEDYFDKDPKTRDKVYAKRGGFLPATDFDPLAYGMAPKDIEATDTSQLLGLVAAQEALEDAGYGSAREFDRSKTSVILGVTGTLELVIPLGARLGHPIWRKAMREAGVDEATIDDAVSRISDSYVDWQENSFPGLLGNVVAGRIANRLNLGGTNCVVDAACASSLSALHLASLELAAGRCDMVVTGGVDTFNDVFMYTCFSKTPALSPTGSAKPFDADGDGTILGEGIGMLVLKRLADAERDGDKIYAVLRGVGSSSDGKGKAIYEPSAEGQVRALRAAYKAADVTPDTIGLVEAHGTGTKVGDAVEASALTEVYRDSKEDGTWCALGSVKSMIGHTKAAAGSAGLIKAALALKNKTLPPTIKVSTPNEKLLPGRTPFYVNTSMRPWLASEEHPRRAAVSSFGFGGSNFHCVLEEHVSAKAAPDFDGRVQILSFCGADKAAVAAELSSFPKDAAWTDLRAKAKELRARFNPKAACRLAVVVEAEKGASGPLNSAAKMLAGDKEAWSTPDGAFFASGPAEGKLAFLFPGQGSQYAGMLRELACQFPEMLDALSEADAAGEGGRLSDRIYPHPTFDAASAARDEEALRATDMAQPAIGAVSLGAAGLLSRFGVKPEAVAGHSYGELTALCLSGRMSRQDFHEMSRLRGKLMAEGGGDKGSMLAVQAPIERVETVVREEGFDLVLANKNAPSQVVLSGKTSEIERAEKRLGELGLRAKRLPVAAAFHSPLVAEARKPFEAALKKVEFAKAEIPVFANTTGAQYPESPAKSRELLANQLARPVEFVAQVRAMHEFGVRTFLEVGPGARLSGLTSAILEGRPFDAMALDSSGARSGQADLARVLAWLAARGHAPALTQWDESFQPSAKPKAKFTVPLTGANYRQAKPARAARPKQAPAAAVSSPAAPFSPAPVSPAVSNSAKPGQSAPVPAFAPMPAQALPAGNAQLEALVRLQEQTAQLHAQFLASQQTALETLTALMQGRPVNYVPAQPFLPAAPAVHYAAPVVSQTVNAAAPQAAAAAKAAPAAAPAAAPSRHAETQKVLLAVVAEKTGYPVEMLNLEMGLDSDLGIDSIKRVEILSALQERMPDAPAVKPDQLGTLRTLGQIVDHLAQGSASAAPAVAAAGQAPARKTSAGKSKTQAVLLEVVAEKTGYPAEMLNLEMGLDSDLGIDSIKRVEILSALQERMPEAPAVKPDQLGTLRTLGQIVDYLSQGASDTEAEAAPASAHGAASAGREKTQSVLLEVVAEKTGYPVEMLNLEMGLDSDLGIDSIKRVEILSALQERMPEAPAVKPDQLGSLRTLGQIVAYLSQGSENKSSAPVNGPAAVSAAASTNGTKPAAATAREVRLSRKALRLSGNLGTRPAVAATEGEIWVTDDESGLAARIVERLRSRGLSASLLRYDEWAEAALPEPLAGLVIVAPDRDADDDFVKKSLFLLKRAAKSLRASRGVFATAARLDGAFGLAGLGADIDPAAGALAGLAKTAAREWPEVQSKAFDIDAGYDDLDAAAESVSAELFLKGPDEVGISASGLRRIELTEEAFGEAGADPVAPGEVVVVSGGARGVTAEAALALAQAFKPTLLLLGRSPAPTPEPEWLARLSSEAEIKKGLAERESGLAPKELEARYRAAAANREMLANIARMERAGSTVLYRSVDARDGEAVGQIIAEVRSSEGPVRGIVHGAGVLADKAIAEKTEEQFDRVYGTKMGGLRALLGAVDLSQLKFAALFSSSTGRFGRSGQVDYAMANEALNKTARQLARLRPQCRVVALNWGPWEGGMVTPSLAKLFAAEGVGLIPLAAGAELMVRELRQARCETEVVVLGETGGVEVQPKPAPTELASVFEREISVEDHPFLSSHVIDGRAVLPMAVIVEWLAHGAMHGNPGLQFAGFDGLRILKGMRLGQGGKARLSVACGRARKDGEAYRVASELRGEGGVVHARAEIVLADAVAAAPAAAEAPKLKRFAGPTSRVYRDYLFHGADLQGIENIEACAKGGIVAVARSAPAPSKWIKKPLRSRWIADPLALDCSFQLMIVWSFERHEAGSLPCFAERYRQYGAFPKDGVKVVVRVIQNGNHRALADIDFLDRRGSLVARIEGYECVIDASLNAAFRKSQLTAA